MVRQYFFALMVVLNTSSLVLAQAPGLPLVPPPSSTPRFFLEGDVQWASPRVNGEQEPRKYDATFIPKLAMGWNLSDDQAVILSYRYLAGDVSTIFHEGVPDAETEVFRHLRLHTIDLMYRERLGGVGMPLGMDVDMGSRFVYSTFSDTINATTIAGPVDTLREQSTLLAGARLGIRPYWTFDQSAWQMTLYAQASGSYLLGTFRSREWVNAQPALFDNTYSSMWNLDAEAGLSSYLPGFEGVLQLTAGYRYEYWSGSRLGFITGTDPGTISMHGPFIRLQWSF